MSQRENVLSLEKYFLRCSASHDDDWSHAAVGRGKTAERKRAIGATGTYVRCTLRRLERNDKAGEKHILRERSRGHRQPRRSRRRQFHLLEHAFKLKAKTTMIFTVERVKEESG